MRIALLDPLVGKHGGADRHVTDALGQQGLIEQRGRRLVAAAHPAMQDGRADPVLVRRVIAAHETRLAAGHAEVEIGAIFRSRNPRHFRLMQDQVWRPAVEQHHRRTAEFAFLLGRHQHAGESPPGLQNLRVEVEREVKPRDPDELGIGRDDPLVRHGPGGGNDGLGEHLAPLHHIAGRAQMGWRGEHGIGGRLEVYDTDQILEIAPVLVVEIIRGIFDHARSPLAGGREDRNADRDGDPVLIKRDVVGDLRHLGIGGFIGPCHRPIPIAAGRPV